ncbi:LytTR family transcriptional regulator DNA-binding domain-containing protein [Vagococcus lutrae]|uniref:LytTR family transcriptional regulator DNA-binding domain-containing protein n=1 Tax=Vagococcus lutrae TaxID=81947 RepID=UPI002A8265E2|nr:LytTR family transcriptional regulator DNA-binding domain-containing protein [Vagococcus lutrae]MDY3706876.1 LytTR family transcriptional regulator DNA-binding domain-containing protein [Vagococcus lutrae]
MNILLVDDEPLARNELSYLLSNIVSVDHITEADSIVEAMNVLKQSDFDVAFLDIQLTQESGLTLARQVKELADPPLIVFATAHDEYAVKAFELEAFDYILKPFEQSRVLEVMTRIERHFHEQHQTVIETVQKREQPSPKLPIKVEESIYLLAKEEIIMITVVNGQTIITTAQKEYPVSKTLKGLMKKLETPPFLQVHRAFVINLDEVYEIQPWFNQTYQVTMSNGQKVPVSRSYLKTFREILGLDV